MDWKKEPFLLKLTASALVLAWVLAGGGGAWAQAPGSINTTNSALGYWLRPENSNCGSTNGCAITTINSNVVPAQTERNGISGPRVGVDHVNLRTSQLNHNPCIEVRNSWFGIKTNLTGTPVGEISNHFTGFVVFRASQVGAAQTNWYDDPALVGGEKVSSMQDFGVTVTSGVINYAHQNGNDNYAITASAFTTGVPHILTIFHEDGGASGDTTAMFLDGTPYGPTVNSLNDDINPDSLFFGSNLTHNATMQYDADYGDVIFYANRIRGWRRQKIHTYLALKYGITLSHHYKLLTGIQNINVYSIDPLYNKGIMGVARCDSTLLDQRASRSVATSELLLIAGHPAVAAGPAQPFAGFPSILNSSFPQPSDNSYLIMGHDGGSVNFTKSFAGGNNNQMGRTYKVHDTNADSVTLFFSKANFPDLDAGLTPGPYFLCYGSDPSFGMGETFVPLVNRGGTGVSDYYCYVDFPDNDTVYCTIVRGSVTFQGPGGVTRGVELWLDAGKGVNNPADVTAWNDQSKNGHNTTCTTGLSKSSTNFGRKLNYRPYVEGRQLDRAFSSGGRFQGKVILAVGQARQNTATANEGWLGFDYTSGLKGLRSDGGNQIQKGGGATDWANGAVGGAILLQNGSSVTTTGSLLNRWTLVAGRRDTTAKIPNGTFYVGGFAAGVRFDSVRFAEIIVLDQGGEGTGTRNLRRLESYLAIKYGLTLTNPYRLSTWDGVAVTNVYDPATYGNDIFGIGRDDNGLLYQRQGMTADVDSLVSFAMGVHMDYDTMNGNPISVDQSFILAGHNGAGVNCWSNSDMAIPGSRGIYQRVEREWKVQKSGGWTTENIQVRLRTDNPNANIPALPQGSTTYYLFTDNDGNFANGGTFVTPMVQSSPGVYDGAVTALSFAAGTSYFTFGTELDSTMWGSPIKCVGGTFKVWGSRLANVCTELRLQSGASIFTGIQGGTISDTSFQVLQDGAGRCIDTIAWRIPSIAPTLPYNLSVDTLGGTGAGCNSGVITANIDNARQIVDSVLVDVGEVAYISWPGDSIYCSNTSNVLPIIGPGTTLGNFSVFAGPLTGNPNVIMPNTTNGQLLVHQGSVGTHTIRYVTNGGGVCKDTADAVIRILAIDTPTISYVGSPYCGGLDSTGAATISGTLGGTFSAAPGILFYNANSGNINVSGSIPGTYTIYYTPHLDSCAVVATTSITITAPQRAYFNYGPVNYCRDGGTVAPFIQSLPGTGQFQEASSSPGGVLSILPASGVVDLGASTTDTFYIEYAVTGSSCFFNARDTIIIRDTTVATFSLAPSDTFCLTAAPFIPSRVNPSGYFTSPGGSVSIAIDSLTVTPSLSSSGGPFTLTYTVPDAYCPDTFSLPIYFRGLSAASIQYSDTVICTNDPNPVPIFLSGSAGGSFLTGAGPTTPFVSAATGELNVSLMTAGNTYEVQYIAPDPACPDTFLVASIDVDAVPSAAFALTPDSLCQYIGGVPINTLPSTGTSNFTVFNGLFPVPGGTSGDSLDTDSLPAGISLMIQNIQTLGACSDTAYDFVTIVEPDTASIAFFPTIICLGGNDPFPLIQGDGGGVFALSVTAPYSIAVAPDSGIIHLVDTMTFGIYWVTYTTQGFCPDIDSSFVDIRDNQTAVFDYADAKVCQTDTGTIRPTTGFTLGGVFRSVPSNLVFVDSLLGIINPSQCPADTFQITYNLSSAGSCLSQYADQLIIVKRDSATRINYGGPYCPSEPDPSPNITGSSAIEGLFSGPGLYFSNQDSGIIALSSTPAGTYEVSFLKRTVCAEEFKDTVVVKPSANAYFTFPGLIYCVGQSDLRPDSIAAYGGLFSAICTDTSGGTLSILDPDSGIVDLVTSNPGSYTVTYYIDDVPGVLCDGTGRQDIRILPQPTNVDMYSDKGDSICDNTYVLFTATGADLIVWELNGDSVDIGRTYEGIRLDSGDVVTANFNTLQGCEDKRSITMHVFERPQVVVQPVPTILAGNEILDVKVLVNTDSTWLRWFVTGLGDVTFDSVAGVTAAVDSSDTLHLGNSAHLDEEGINPASMTYTITPHTFLCTSPPITFTININPNDLAVFVPQVITPDGNGANDVWKIQLKNGVNASDYKLLLFNSAGALVHTMSPLVFDFNGENSDKGYLPDGVYWYLLYDNTGTKIDAGGLTIRRK